MRGFAVDYDRRLDSLIKRRTAPVELFAKSARTGGEAVAIDRYQASPTYEVYNRLGSEGSAVRYAVGAMARVDPKYTEVTYQQGDRVQSQLKRAFDECGIGCDFEYQGSVTNDTHIKSHSDIDLLAITQRFTVLEHPQKPRVPYDGNPAADLKEIRTASSQGLRKAFPAAEVDDKGSKSVAISGGSLSRKIDVVPANWYDTNAFANSQAKRYRAIQVLDVKTGQFIKNAPFMHNYLLAQRDQQVAGGLRKVVRLMKSLRYDSGNVSLSSYDLAAIGYVMPEHQLLTAPGEELALWSRLKSFLDLLAEDDDFRGDMLVPDESRHIFVDGHATLAGLNELRGEVSDLVEAVCSDRQKSFHRLAEARVAY